MEENKALIVKIFQGRNI